MAVISEETSNTASKSRKSLESIRLVASFEDKITSKQFIDKSFMKESHRIDELEVDPSDDFNMSHVEAYLSDFSRLLVMIRDETEIRTNFMRSRQSKILDDFEANQTSLSF